MSKKRVDIIICTYNNSEYTIPCLGSIALNTEHPYRVIMIDNGSKPKEIAKVNDFLASMEEPFPHLWIFNQQNFGFAKGNNVGIRISDAPMILLLNNDTIVTPGWLGRLVKIAESDKNIGLVGPMNQASHGWQTVKDLQRFAPKLPNMNGRGFMAYQKMLNGMSFTGKHVKKPWLAFYCTLIKRSVLDKVGYLQEKYGYGFAEDNDYCFRAKKAGYACACAIDTIILHYRRTTFESIWPNKGWKELQRHNLQMLINECGRTAI